MIASGAPAWAVWVALGLWVAAIALAVVVVYAARAQWRRLKPTVLPMLQALGFAPLPGRTAIDLTLAAPDELVDTRTNDELLRVYSQCGETPLPLCGNCGRPSSEHTQESGGCPPDCKTSWAASR